MFLDLEQRSRSFVQRQVLVCRPKGGEPDMVQLRTPRRGPLCIKEEREVLAVLLDSGDRSFAHDCSRELHSLHWWPRGHGGRG